MMKTCTLNGSPSSAAKNGRNSAEIGGDMSRTLFTQMQYNLNGLISAVRMGEIGLPDIQRPFIWKNTKVCGLCCLVPR